MIRALWGRALSSWRMELAPILRRYGILICNHDSLQTTTQHFVCLSTKHCEYSQHAQDRLSTLSQRFILWCYCTFPEDPTHMFTHMANHTNVISHPRWLSGLMRSRVHSLWLLVDHCVLRNWDRILVRAVKGLISRAGMVSICPLLWQRDVKLQQTNKQTQMW